MHPVDTLRHAPSVDVPGPGLLASEMLKAGHSPPSGGLRCAATLESRFWSKLPASNDHSLCTRSTRSRTAAPQSALLLMEARRVRCAVPVRRPPCSRPAHDEAGMLDGPRHGNSSARPRAPARRADFDETRPGETDQLISAPHSLEAAT
jgi:hypothetical protein